MTQILDQEWQHAVANSIAHAAEAAANQVHACAIDVAHQHMRPSAVFRPELSIDGDQWCALYGRNLVEGVAGFGDTAEAAMLAFDGAWHSEKPPAIQEKPE